MTETKTMQTPPKIFSFDEQKQIPEEKKNIFTSHCANVKTKIKKKKQPRN